MRVMFDVTDPDERMHTMTERKVKSEASEVKGLSAGDEAFIRSVVRTALQEMLEAEMTEALSVAKGGGAARLRRSGRTCRTIAEPPHG